MRKMLVNRVPDSQELRFFSWGRALGFPVVNVIKKFRFVNNEDSFFIPPHLSLAVNNRARDGWIFKRDLRLSLS